MAMHHCDWGNLPQFTIHIGPCFPFWCPSSCIGTFRFVARAVPPERLIMDTGNEMQCFRASVIILMSSCQLGFDVFSTTAEDDLIEIIEGKS